MKTLSLLKVSLNFKHHGTFRFRFGRKRKVFFALGKINKVYLNKRLFKFAHIEQKYEVCWEGIGGRATRKNTQKVYKEKLDKKT